MLLLISDILKFAGTEIFVKILFPDAGLLLIFNFGFI